MSEIRTWFITGCSSGMGRQLARQLLERGEHVVATARDPASLDSLIAGHEDNGLALKLDVTREEDIQSAVAAARARFGAIDVLVNNAGYGHLGSVEEIELDAVRAAFDTNFFGAWRLIQAVLPDMRARRRGWIANIASVNGLVAIPMSSGYCTSKFALVGLTEALRMEVAPLGIKVTVIEPGPFNTDFSSRSLQMTPPATPDYDIVEAFERAGVSDWQENGGDPASGAAAIIRTLELPDPPLHMLLGQAALGMATEGLRDHLASIEQWKDVSLSSDIAPLQ